MLDNIKLALSGLRANVMRTLLTLLGIVIGIASVIAIMTIGAAMNLAMQQSMAAMGMNNFDLTISTAYTDDDSEVLSVQPVEDPRADIPNSALLTPALLGQLQEKLGVLIKNISYQTDRISGTVSSGHETTDVSVQGASQGFLSASGMSKIMVSDGRWLNEKDSEGFKKVAVIRENFAEQLFGSADAALGQQIDITTKKPVTTITVTVVGTYKGVATDLGPLGGSIDFSSMGSPVLYLPVETVLQILGKTGVQSATIAGADDADTNLLKTKLNDFFDEAYHAKGYTCEIDAPSGGDSMDETVKTLQLSFSVVAAISLLVGGIGVMNIMMVSITERTREIGVCKALGARRNDIRMQFITESVIICLIGGFIGILFGLGLGYGAAKYMNYPTTASPWSVAVAFGFSLFIGVFFGYYPANKAAKMNPIDALRYE